jgi:hypothetical protein
LNQNNKTGSFSAIAAALAVVGLLGCVQPWIVVSTSSMTLNVYDLAEWASLAPAQSHTSPPLLASLLLRLQPVILCVILGAVVDGRAKKTIAAIAILMLAAAQLPPFEYIYDINNINYRQQFFLAVASLAGGWAAIRFWHQWLSALAVIVLPIVGLATAALGLSQAEALYRQFQMSAAAGAGIVLLSVSYLALLVVSARDKFARGEATA